jgi:ribosome biogenesis GTPase
VPEIAARRDSFRRVNDRLLPDAAALGLTDDQRAAFEALALDRGLVGRVVSEAKGEYRVWADRAEFTAECTGKLFGRAAGRGELPAVGDWVALTYVEALRAMVVAVLPRTTAFTRRAAGHGAVEQVVAANIDVVFLAMGLDADFNLRRIERYLAVAWESGASPVVLLTKCDLVDDPEAKAAEVRAVAGRAPVVVTSAVDAIGLDAVRDVLGPGKTVAILGSSGAGKSTLANALLARDALRVGEVRAHDQRGRHTTTHRELFVLPSGALLIDTPGMRELQLWDVSHGLDAAFEDVAAVATRCRFRDCQHGAEPGCAVRDALADGSLDRERYANWSKLRGEAQRAREAIRERGRGGGRRVR